MNENKEIHHIDLNRSNNRPENLLRLSKEDHVKVHRQLRDLQSRLKLTKPELIFLLSKKLILFNPKVLMYYQNPLCALPKNEKTEEEIYQELDILFQKLELIEKEEELTNKALERDREYFKELIKIDPKFALYQKIAQILDQDKKQTKLNI